MNIPSTFKIVFLVIVGFTLVSFIGLGVLAVSVRDVTTEAELSVFDRSFLTACTFGWQAGLGAILGLVGGKVTE